ncbi:hypothetical protein ACX27O_29865 [Micromonospora sp. SD19]|uniref:DUF3558 domain-containing protein n=2 Tax=Micromonospora saelicesensis TaxID=285676 RepID=A0A1C4Z2F8_9ACTN|nr:hypothetical protein GA0070561_4849 [Micromonospora saelicesensis]
MILPPLSALNQYRDRRKAYPFFARHRAVAAMAVFVAVVLAATGCTEHPGVQDASGTTTATTASDTAGTTRTAEATTPTAGASTAAPYRPVDALCSKVALTPISEIVGPVGSQQDDSRAAGSTVSTACTATVGRLPNGIVVTVRADIGAPGSGRLLYEGLRQAQQSDGPSMDVIGLGSAAYAYVDRASGFAICAYDANLYLTVTAAPLRPGTVLRGDLPARVRAVAASTLAALRT